jgi:hypothetical protein
MSALHVSKYLRRRCETIIGTKDSIYPSECLLKCRLKNRFLEFTRSVSYTVPNPSQVTCVWLPLSASKSGPSQGRIRYKRMVARLEMEIVCCIRTFPACSRPRGGEMILVESFVIAKSDIAIYSEDLIKAIACETYHIF